jgi:hypothetical protein
MGNKNELVMPNGLGQSHGSVAPSQRNLVVKTTTAVDERIVDSLGVSLAGVKLQAGTNVPGSSALVEAPELSHWGTFSIAGNQSFPGPVLDPRIRATQPVAVNDIDRFLSQDPSHSLGAEVFRLNPLLDNSSQYDGLLSSVPDDRRSVSNESDKSRTPTFDGALVPTARDAAMAITDTHLFLGERRDYNIRRTRTESPSCSVTGTTSSSRSGSPPGLASDGSSRNYSNPLFANSLRRAESANIFASQSSATRCFQPGNGNRLAPSLYVDSRNEGRGNWDIAKAAPSHPGSAFSGQTRSFPDGSANQLNSFSDMVGHNHHQQSDAIYVTSLRQHIPSAQQYSQQPHYQVPDMRPFDCGVKPSIENSGYTASVQSHALMSGHQQATNDIRFRNQMPLSMLQVGNARSSQVLYMAVPSRDGRGQVLQPVQMVASPDGNSVDYARPEYHNVPLLSEATNEPDRKRFDSNEALCIADKFSCRTRGFVHGDQNIVGRHRLSASSSHTFTKRQEYEESNTLLNEGEVSIVVDGISYTAESCNSLYSSQPRPSLDVLVGQIRRLSRDQVGCRLVQQALDEEGPMAASLILTEGFPFWGEAMIDPFGNYLFQKILEKVTPEERIMLINSVSSRLVNASLNLHGTRSVQKVVELCAQDEDYFHGRKSLDSFGNHIHQTASDILVKALLPAAARLCIDSHGNHVIQRILLKLSPKHSKFVFNAVAASVSDVARHRHGCCVIQRCLDSPASASRTHLVERIVEKALELMQDAYGNYVVQYVLDVCADQYVHTVCESVVGRVSLLAIQKFSSNVMEKCFERCSDRVREEFIAEICDSERIRELMMDPFGNYVVQRALSVATHDQAMRLVEAMRPHLMAQMLGPHGHRNGGIRNTAGGRRIIAKICRRFPNFTLSDVGSFDEINVNASMKNNHRYPYNIQSHENPLFPSRYGVIENRPISYEDVNEVSGLFPSTHKQEVPQTYYSVVGNPYYDQFTSFGHASFPGL